MTLAHGPLARADVCASPRAPWLRVTFGGDAFAAPLRARVLEQLGADLTGHGIALCEASGEPSGEGSGARSGEGSGARSGDASGAAPLADIALALSGESVLSLEVRDAVTDKRMLRDLRLGSVPRDALALSIALAAEELLHASWIEAALTPPPATPTPPALATVPPAVREVDEEQMAKMVGGGRATSTTATATTTTTTVALLAAGGGASSGESELGGDLRFAWGGRFAIGARVGFRELHDVVRVHGVIHGQDLQAGVAASYAFVPRTASWGGEVSLRADLVDVRFSGVAAPGASGRSDSALGAVVSGALGGWAKLGGPFRAVADAAVGTPLHSVSALDAGDKVTGISGVTFGLALGLGVSLQ